MSNDISSFRKASLINLGKQFGLDEGKTMIAWLRERMAVFGYSGYITFKQLHKMTGKTLVIGAADVYKREMKYFSHVTEPDCQVVHAIRMSCGIPFAFTIWKYKESGYVDGAVLDNFPLQEFGKNATSESKVLGIVLHTTRTDVRVPVESLFDYADRLISMVSDKADETILNHIPEFCSVIKIQTDREAFFSAKKKTKEKLFTVGVNTTKEFLSSNMELTHKAANAT